MKKKLFIVLLVLTLGLIVNTAIAQDTNEQRVKDTFACYGFIPSRADISYWKNSAKSNQYGTLANNLERRFLQKYMARLDEFGNFICVPDPQKIGAVPFLPSRFKTTLGSGLASGLATDGNYRILLSSKTTFDGHTLVTQDFGTATSTITIPIHLNPSGSTDEIAICQGVSPTSTALIDCDRGFNFYNNLTTAANVKAHSAGESIIISNDIHFIANQFVNIYENQFIYGNKTFATTTEAITRLYFGDNRGAYFWYNSTTDQFGWASSTSEFQFNSGGTQFTAIDWLKVLSGELKAATSTNDFYSSANTLYILKNNSITSNSSGLALNTTTDFVLTGNWNFAHATVSDSLVWQGNSTSTKSLDIKQLCFNGTDCVNGVGRVATSSAGTLTINTTASSTLWSYTINSNTLYNKSLLHFSSTGSYGVSNNTGALGIKFNNVEIMNGKICIIPANTVSTWSVNVDVIFGSGNDVVVSGYCDVRGDTTPFENYNFIWTLASSTVKFSTENIGFSLLASVKNASDNITTNGFYILEY